MEECDLVVAEPENSEKRIKGSILWTFRTAKTKIQGTQIDNSLIEKFYTARKFLMQFLMPTLMEEITPVVFVKYEFENREKFKLKRIPSNFWTIRLPKQKRTTMIVYSSTRLQVMCSRMRF